MTSDDKLTLMKNNLWIYINYNCTNWMSRHQRYISKNENACCSSPGLRKYVHWRTYIFVQAISSKMFWPSTKKNRWGSETNDTSFESSKIELLESGEKLGMALSWSWGSPYNQKSTSFTRICLEAFKTEIRPISILLSNSEL